MLSNLTKFIKILIFIKQNKNIMRFVIKYTSVVYQFRGINMDTIYC